MKIKNEKTFFYILAIIVIIIGLFVFLQQKKENLIKNPSQYLPVKTLDKIILENRLKIEDNPEDIFAYIESGIANYQKGKDCYPEGINQFQKALKLGAVDIRILFYLSIMYDELNLTDKAFNYYEKFLRNRPGDVYIRLRYGNLYFKLHRYDSATEQYEIASSVEPKNQTAIINLALSYKARDMYDEAINKFKQAQNLKKPLSSEILMKIAETYFIKNDFINAKTYYEKTVSKKQDSVPALMGLGETYLKLNQKEEAKKYFQKVINIDATNSKAKKYLSE
jgi:tetratricopeptide (TPR) repeat protein